MSAAVSSDHTGSIYRASGVARTWDQLVAATLGFASNRRRILSPGPRQPVLPKWSDSNIRGKSKQSRKTGICIWKLKVVMSEESNEVGSGSYPNPSLGRTSLVRALDLRITCEV